MDELRRQQRQKGCKESGSLMEEEEERWGGGREGVDEKSGDEARSITSVRRAKARACGKEKAT